MPYFADLLPKFRAPVAADRRSQERLVTYLPISIFSVAENLTTYPGVCKNLSRGGVGFETDARLRVGQVVEFEFVDFADEAVRYSIQILSRDGHYYGARYVDVDDDS